MNARGLLTGLLDAGTFRPWDTAEAGPAITDSAYAVALARARAATGVDESVITGEGLLRGRRVAVAASEFGFLGGSIGVAAGERLTSAVERATGERLPLVVLPASGGTRMQEGTLAFLQMIKITAAVTAHKSAGLPYLVYLRHPTTGGVFASWASLGHLTLAEPGALIGFLGPRVYAALVGRPFPDGVQTAENLRAHGLVDAVLPPAELAAYLDSVLTAIAPAEHDGVVAPRPAAPEQTAPPAWQSVLRTREPGRPGASELIDAMATDVVRLRETGLILALARAGGHPCVLVAQDRPGPAPGVVALRLARRGMLLAEELRIPLVTVLDTPGAELSPQAEEQGLASEIAHCIALMINLRTATVAVLLGEGTGGGALALLPADRIVAAQDAWLAPLAPEGASAIVYKDTAHAPELAARQRIRSVDLASDGIVDRVIADTDALCDDLGRAVHDELRFLTHQDDAARMTMRLQRYRRLGPND